jgi:hypothetical protein
VLGYTSGKWVKSMPYLLVCAATSSLLGRVVFCQITLLFFSAFLHISVFLLLLFGFVCYSVCALGFWFFFLVTPTNDGV